MIRFFQFLGINEEGQSKLPKDILDGGRLIDGMQLIYEDMPEGHRKDIFAHTIAEMASILLANLNKIRIGVQENKKIQEEIELLEDDLEKRVEVTPIQEVEITEVIDEGKSEEKDLFLEHIKKDLSNLEF